MNASSESTASRLSAVRLGGPNGRIVNTTAGTLVNFSAPNYLGLANHPAMIDAARHALDRFGVGPGASPTVSGRNVLHDELEAELCRRVDTEAAV